MTQLNYRRYPSTTALQCFECTARHLSFTRASKELYMTQSAVSKQVAQLEELLGVPLFYRGNSGLFLSPAGKAYYSETQKVLQHLESATLDLMAHGAEAVTLHIISHATFCAQWLIPALKGFGQAHPLIHLDISEQTHAMLDDDSDMGFVYGDGVWADMEAVKLFDERSVAVCAPNYFSDLGLGDLANCSDEERLSKMAHARLIQIRTRPRAWYDYFHSQGHNHDSAFVGARFDTFNACIKAAKIGCGVALVPLIFVREQLKSGDLVLAHPYELAGQGAYYMVYQAQLATTNKVQTMRAWILDYLAR